MATQGDANSDPESKVERGPDWSVANQVRHLSNGEKAALKRMYLTQSYQADGIVEKLLRGAKVKLDSSDDVGFDSWCLLAHAAAVISGTTKRFAHSDEGSLGRSLHAMGAKETSVLRLISARGPAICDQVRRVARILARGGKEAVPTNLATLRELADPNAAIAERARRLIAREFFAANDAGERPAKGDAK